jgi:hypothetical protein
MNFMRTFVWRLLAIVWASSCFAQVRGPDPSIIGPQPDYAATELKAEPWPLFVHDALFAPATGINVVGTVSALLPAWPFEAPVSVTIADSAGNIVGEHHEITPLHARHLVELRRAVPPGTYVVTMRIDPHNVVNEIDEANNEIKTRVEVTDTVPPAIDLYPITTALKLDSIEISASAKNEGVHDWLDATVSSALAAEAWYYDHVIRLPDATTDRADLLVELLLQPGDHEKAITHTAGTVQELWFVQSVAILDAPTPQPLPGTEIKPLTDQIGASAVSPIIIAPQIVTLAVTLSPTDEARQYLQVSVPIIQDGRGPIPLIAKFPPDPVSVRFESMTADGKAAFFHTIVRPGLPGEAKASGFLPKADGHLKGMVTVDPDNAIAEYDEDNNVAEFTTEPPPPENDLTPHCDRANSRSVTVTADARNPVLLELVRRTGLQTLGDNHASLFLNVFPWHRGLPGVLDFVRPDITHDFDLLVVAPVLDIVARGSDNVSQALVDTYSMQWYVQDAVALDSLPFWTELQTVDIRPQYPVVIGIKLTAADIAMQYRRVSLPIEYSHDAIPLPANRFDASLPFFDNGSTRFAPPIAVEFSYGTAREGAVRDYLTFEFGVRRATGFLLETDAEVPVNVFIDPFDILEERDETNNACEVRNIIEPPRGRLHAKADIRADGTLTVIGSFSNPSEQAIVLRFTSGLQMDFTVNDEYRWSANKFFTEALTEVTVAPGASHEWILDAPVDDILDQVGPADVWHIEVELVGTDYQAQTHVRPPSIDPPSDPGPGLPPFPDDILDLIVGPDGLDFSLLGDGFQIIKPPDGGDLFNDFQVDSNFHYAPAAHYGGVDYVTFRVGEGDNTRDVMRRLKVGPQEHDLELAVGWNLVSFPTRPFESAAELITRVPDGKAWDFRNGDYRELRKIAVGRGIWLYSGESATLSYLGEPIGEPRIELSEGWNIMGAVNPDSIPDDPRILAIYDFDGAGFEDARELRTGQGYWLYASRPFTLPLK